MIVATNAELMRRDVGRSVRTGAWICVAGSVVVIVAGALPYSDLGRSAWRPGIGVGGPFEPGSTLATALSWWWWPSLILVGSVLLLTGRVRHSAIAWGTLLVSMGWILPALLRQFDKVTAPQTPSPYATGYWLQIFGFVIAAAGSAVEISGMRAERGRSVDGSETGTAGPVP